MSDRLEEIEARASAATPGPWRQGDWSGRCHQSHYPHPGPPECRYEYELRQDGSWASHVARENPITLIGGHDNGPWLDPADAAFIAHSREDVPWLIAEVKRLRGAVNYLCDVREGLDA
jgi:hypothetical protein